MIGIAEYFVICSGINERQVKAISDSIYDSSINLNIRPISIEGQRESEWILLDFESVVVHIFHEEFRRFYRLESLYKDVDKIDWNVPERKAG